MFVHFASEPPFVKDDSETFYKVIPQGKEVVILCYESSLMWYPSSYTTYP